MVRSKNLSKLFNIAFPFADFLYILQQEEYNTQRYVKWLPRFFWRRNFQMRDQLHYTKRIASTLVFIVVIWLIPLGIILSMIENISFRVVLILLWLIAIPIFVLVGNVILNPYYDLLKHGVFRKAGEKIGQHKNLRVVTVAGSFGKTTTKNFIHELVRHTYRTQMIPGNINTPIGIAQWIMQDLRIGTELLIIEIDGYHKDEVADSSRMVPADIAIITNIGDQYLERFGTKKKLAIALGEVFHFAKPNAALIANAETAEALRDIPRGQITIVDNDIANIHLSASSRADLVFAIAAAKILNIPDDFIVHTCENLEIPDRRQKITQMYGYDCVDDSYNISFTTAQAGIAAADNLAKAKHKKILAVTAGIPELSPADRGNNKALGGLLAKSTDHIVVLESIFARDITEGITDPQKYTLCADLKDFFAVSHAKFPPEHWILFLEPELTDLYY